MSTFYHQIPARAQQICPVLNQLHKVGRYNAYVRAKAFKSLIDANSVWSTRAEWLPMTTEVIKCQDMDMVCGFKSQK